MKIQMMFTTDICKGKIQRKIKSEKMVKDITCQYQLKETDLLLTLNNIALKAKIITREIWVIL